MDRPLTLDEEIEAAQLLSDSGPRTLVFARGLFAASAVSPKPMDPTEWLPMLVGDKLADPTELKRLLTLLIRDANSIRNRVTLGQPITPVSDDEDVVREFCKGFVQVAQRLPDWTANQTAFDLTLPMMVLSGYVEPGSLASLRPEAAVDPAGYRRDCLRRLSGAISALYDFFREARTNHERLTEPQLSQKVGRNDPCPCGSGKKFKKCCAP